MGKGQGELVGWGHKIHSVALEKCTENRFK